MHFLFAIPFLSQSLQSMECPEPPDLSYLDGVSGI